jgi:hypothetical protein
VRIGIIGAGHIGATLTRRLRALGHAVAVANSRGPASLARLASDTGAEPVAVGGAVRGRDLVVIAIPEYAVPALPRGLFDAAGGAVVVDAGNYYPRRDSRIAEIEAGMTESGWVALQIGRPVIKAFNTIAARDLLERGLPPGSPGRMSIPVAGDDAGAKRLVLSLVDSLGVDAVDAGTLDESWRQQPGTPVFGAALGADATRRALAQAGRRLHG